MLMTQLLSQTYSLSQTVKIHLIEYDFVSLDTVFRRLKEESKTKVKIQGCRMNIIMYERLRNRGIGTHEIESFARSITHNSGNKWSSRNPWHQKEVMRLLGLRIDALKRTIRKHEKTIKNMRTIRISMMKKQFNINKEFNHIIKNFIKDDWQHRIEKCNKKIRHLTNIYRSKMKIDKDVQEVKNKILVTDEQINKWIDEETVKEPESSNYIVYGECKLDHDEINYLNQPADHRIVDPVDRDTVENEAKKFATTVRYNNMNQDVYPDQTNADKETWFDRQTKTINFGSLKVTKFKFNGRIYPPKPGTKLEEIEIERMKTEYVNEGTKYVEGQKGNIGNMD